MKLVRGGTRFLLILLLFLFFVMYKMYHEFRDLDNDYSTEDSENNNNEQQESSEEEVELDQLHDADYDFAKWEVLFHLTLQQTF